jgi:hypothetical protein
MGALQVQNEFQKLQDAQKLRAVQTEMAAKFAPGQSAAPQQAPAMGGGTAASLMNAALGGSPVAPPSAPTPVVPDKRAVAQRYQAMGDYLMSKGFQPEAQKYYDLAQKALPQIKDQQVRTDPKTGQRVVVNVYNDGSQEIMRDVAPDKEKLNFQNTGGAIVGLDPFTGQPGSAAIPTSMTPGETANNQVALANLALARQREAREAANAPGTKPVWDPTAGQFVLPPSTDNPTGKALTPTGFTKPEKALTEQQGNALMFGKRMSAANNVIDGLSQTMNVTSPANLLAASPLTNPIASPNAQKLEQAKRDFMTAGLRKESGASISKSEYQMYDRTYFPQIGDSPEVLAQKAALRKRAIEGMMTVAGSAAPKGGWTVQRVN